MGDGRFEQLGWIESAGEPGGERGGQGSRVCAKAAPANPARGGGGRDGASGRLCEHPLVRTGVVRRRVQDVQSYFAADYAGQIYGVNGSSSSLLQIGQP